MAETKTQYVDFIGKAYFARVYQPDEFRGSVRWGVDLVPEDQDEWDKFKKTGIQKVPKERDFGKYFPMHRPTVKLMKGKLVYFTAPFIYDKDGNAIVKYVDDAGNEVRSYEDKNKNIKRVGEPILIGNGSIVKINVSYFPTAMGVGCRLETLRILDLIEYKKLETPSEVAKKIEEQVANGEEPIPPW